MKQIILTFGLILCGSVLFGQSPRIRLNQITKDSLTGSVVLSGSDSNMVYSRDFFLNLTDSVLILFGDTLSTTATAFTGVTTNLTLTGNGTVGNELKVDTAVIATISALSDSLATLSFATNQDISDSLATLSFASLQDITDTLDLNSRDFITGLRLTDTLNTNSRGFLTQNQTITLTDDATGTGTTSISVTVVDDSHNHTITTLTGIQDSLNLKAALVHTHIISDVAFLQDSLDAKANDSDLNNYLLTSNYIVDSTRINATGDTAYYYQNGVLIGTGAIAGGGGGGSGTVTSITAGTYLSGGTITTSGTIALDTASAGLKTYISENIGTVDLASEVTGTLPVANGGTGATTLTSGTFLKGNGTSAVSGSSNLSETADTVYVAKFLNVDTATLYVNADSNRVGIGTSSPIRKFHVFGVRNDVIRVQTNETGSNLSSGFEFGNNESSEYTGFSRFQSLDGDMLLQNLREGANDDLIFTTNGSFLAETSNKVIMKNNGEFWIGYTTDQGNYRLQVQDSVYVGGNVSANAYTTRSDIRLKENITQYNNGLNDVLNLNPVYFYQKEFPTKQRLGFIAQDVRDIIPQAITDEEQNDYLGIEYSALIPVLTKAIQEQQAIIELQKSEIEQLKTQYNDLLQRIINLENK